MRLLPQHRGDWVISLNKMAGKGERTVAGEMCTDP